jgi:hypothetical protein
MDLTLNRRTFTSSSTIGDLLIDGAFECFTLEDVVRTGPKVPGQTAIPFSRYEVVVDFSNRFARLMPHLLNVPNFDGIRIHSGNTGADTEGCILLGQEKSVDAIQSSRAAFDVFFPKLQAAAQVGKVFITIVDTRADVTPVAPTPPAPTTRSVTVTSPNRLNLRTAATRTANVVRTYPDGTRLEYIEAVSGESVQGVSTWYKTPDGFFFWSGGVTAG